MPTTLLEALKCSLPILLLAGCLPAGALPSPQMQSPTPQTTDTATPQTSQAPAPTSTPFPTTDPAALRGEFLVYTNQDFGFHFEYPAVYAMAPYTACAPTPKGVPEGTAVYLGARSLLLITPDDRTIEAYAEQTIAEREFTLEGQAYTTVAGRNALEVEYRFGGGRYGTFTVFREGGRLYAFNITAGVFCDIQEAGVFEFSAYDLMISTFEFLETGE